MASDYGFIFLDVLKANGDNIVIGDPEDMTTKDGTSICRSTIKYRDDRNVLCDMYFAGPKQFTFGVSKQWPFGMKKMDQNDNNVKTYQVCYNLTDISRVNNPSIEEQYMQEIL